MHTSSERSQYKKATYSMTPIIWRLGKGKTIESKKKKNQPNYGSGSCKGFRGRGGGRDEKVEHMGF